MSHKVSTSGPPCNSAGSTSDTTEHTPVRHTHPKHYLMSAPIDPNKPINPSAPKSIIEEIATIRVHIIMAPLTDTTGQIAGTEKLLKECLPLVESMVRKEGAAHPDVRETANQLAFRAFSPEMEMVRRILPPKGTFIVNWMPLVIEDFVNRASAVAGQVAALPMDGETLLWFKQNRGVLARVAAAVKKGEVPWREDFPIISEFEALLPKESPKYDDGEIMPVDDIGILEEPILETEPTGPAAQQKRSLAEKFRRFQKKCGEYLYEHKTFSSICRWMWILFVLGGWGVYEYGEPALVLVLATLIVFGVVFLLWGIWEAITRKWLECKVLLASAAFLLAMGGTGVAWAVYHVKGNGSVAAAGRGLDTPEGREYLAFEAQPTYANFREYTRQYPNGAHYNAVLETFRANLGQVSAMDLDNFAGTYPTLARRFGADSLLRHKCDSLYGIAVSANTLEGWEEYRRKVPAAEIRDADERIRMCRQP